MKKILVVDDEKDVCDMIKSLLETEGYEVDTSYDGQDCLNRTGDDRYGA